MAAEGTLGASVRMIKLKLASTTAGTDVGSAVGLAVGIDVGLAVGLLEGPALDPPEGTAVGCWLSSEVVGGTVCDPLGSRVVCEEVVFNEGPALGSAVWESLGFKAGDRLMGFDVDGSLGTGVGRGTAALAD